MVVSYQISRIGNNGLGGRTRGVGALALVGFAPGLNDGLEVIMWASSLVFENFCVMFQKEYQS